MTTFRARTRIRAIATVIVAGAAAWLMLSATASPASALMIKAAETRITQLGGFHPARNPELKHAIRAFGKPSGRRHFGFGKGNCLVRWKKFKLRITFANYGGYDACSKKHGRAQSVVIGFSKRWRTNRELRVGHSVKRLKHRYPNARRHGSRYWLKTAHSPFGFGYRYPVLEARTHRLKWVSGFEGWIGKAGE